MRKNVKQQLALRVLSTAALVAMVSSIATAAFADTYDLTKGSVEIVAKDGIQSITQRDDTGAFVKDEKGENIDNRQDDDITLTTKNKDTGETETTSNTVTIDAKEGNTANVTLQDVHIEVDTTDAKSGAIEIKGDGDTKLELNGDNTVLVENGWSEEHAAIEKADAYGTGTLTIKDDVNDNGTAKTGTDEDTTGKLLAGGYHGSAAIGGGRYSGDLDLRDTSNITITGGEITAIGGNDGCAGIGGGYNGTGKNIRIEGNAHVTAVAGDGAAIGGGIGSGNSVTITDDAVVDAYSAFAAAIGNGDNCGRSNDPTTITISGNATVHAENSQRGGCAIGNSRDGSLSDLTVNIEKNANVTAISSYDCPAIGTPLCIGATTTTINITGGTVNAINSFGSDNPEYSSQYDGTRDTNPAIGTTIDSDRSGTCNVNINSSTGDTVVNAYIYGKGSGTAVGSTIKTTSYNPYNVEYQYVPADSASYKADGSSHFGEINSAIVNCYNNGTVAKEKLNLPSTKDPLALNYNKYSHTITGGTLTKVVHNRKYMEEHPEEIVDITKLKDEDLHDWQLVKRVEPTLDADGYADYICSIDKCGQTKHVVLPKIVPDTPSTPETPDTPDTPNTPSTPDTPSTPNTPSTPSTPNTPSTPDTPDTPSTPVTPDAPVQDAVPDTAPADAAVAPAAAQNVVQDAKPEAAATAPAAAAALPQTGANWLAVVGSALSGLFLLAAGFVLDRKGRRMN